MEVTGQAEVVFAAGAIVWRDVGSRREVLLVHRRRYKDWTLPKGKLETGESFEQAALREVLEETGCTGELKDFLGAIGYKVHERPKIVLFWSMKLSEQASLADHEEVLKTKWMSIPAALAHLSHGRERKILELAWPPEMTSPPGSHFWSWFWGERSYARLLREYEGFCAELAFLEAQAAGQENTWASAAHLQLQNMPRYLQRRDVEAGWYCLHAVQRIALFALSEAQLQARTQILRRESEKIPGWRGRAIADLLDSRHPEVTVDRLIQATALRDEYAANQYHKIWLMADQLGVLIWLSLVTGLVLLGALWRLPDSPAAWSVPMFLAVIAFGILGASFSAAQSLISSSIDSRIPERVTNHYVTIIRAMFGSTTGLAGYAFFRSGLFSVDKDSTGVAISFAVAFLFGYAGERLIAGIAARVKPTNDK